MLLVHSKDKQTFEGELVESQEISRPPSAEDALQAEHSLQYNEEKGNDSVQATKKPFDTLSTKTTESVIPPPPDGGLHAWLKVFGGFMIYVHTVSVLHTALSNHSSDKHLGLHTQLRRFPGLLQIRPSLLLFRIGNIMDWYGTSMAAHLHRRPVRPAV